MRGAVATCLSMTLAAATAVQGADTGGVVASAGADLASAYVWRGITLSGAPVIQPWLDVSGVRLGEHASLGINVWANLGLKPWRTGPGDDQELAIAGGEISEIDISLALRLHRGFELVYHEYTFPTTEALPAQGTRELHLGWHGAGILDPSIGVFYDFDEVGDYFAVAALSKSVNASARAELGLSLEAGFAGPRFAAFYGGAQGGPYHLAADLKATYHLGERLSLGGTLGYVGSLRQSVLPRQDVGMHGSLGSVVTF